MGAKQPVLPTEELWQLRPRDRTLVALLGMSQLGRSRLQPSRSPYSRFSPSPAFQAKRPGCPRFGGRYASFAVTPGEVPFCHAPCRTPQGFLRPTTGHTVGRQRRGHTGDSRDLERAIARVWGGCWTDCRHSGEARSTLAASHAADSGMSWGDTAC
jgi:hypothetical protein